MPDTPPIKVDYRNPEDEMTHREGCAVPFFQYLLGLIVGVCCTYPAIVLIGQLIHTFSDSPNSGGEAMVVFALFWILAPVLGLCGLATVAFLRQTNHGDDDYASAHVEEPTWARRPCYALTSIRSRPFI